MHDHPVAQNETGRLEIPSFPIGVGPDLQNNLIQIEAVTDGKRQPVTLCRSRPILSQVNGKREDSYAKFCEPSHVRFEISQLLTAERSPMTPIEEEDHPPGQHVPWEANSRAIDE